MLNRCSRRGASLQALLTNPLVHTDHRCTETICQFLNPECNFKQYTPSYSVGKAKLGGFVKKAKHDFGSFMDLFLITEEESRKAAMAAMAAEHAKWAIWNKEVEEKRAQPDQPEWEYTVPATESETCFMDDPAATPELIGFANKGVHLLGKIVDRLRHGWFWRSLLGLVRFIFGGTIEANVVALCAPMVSKPGLAALPSIRSVLLLGFGRRLTGAQCLRGWLAVGFRRGVHRFHAKGHTGWHGQPQQPRRARRRCGGHGR